MSPNNTPPVDPGLILATIIGGISSALAAANWKKIAAFIGKLLTTLFGDKRSTKEYPVVNGSALTATNFESLIALVKEQGKDIDELKADNEAWKESFKALEKKDAEIVENWRTEFRDFKISASIDTGRAIAKRTSELEGDLAQQATEIKVAQLDSLHWSQAIISALEINQKTVATSLDSMQESLNMFLDVAKVFMVKLDKLIPDEAPPVAPMPPPSNAAIAAKRESLKHITDDIKPVDIKPDVHKPTPKPEDTTPPDEAA